MSVGDDRELRERCVALAIAADRTKNSAAVIQSAKAIYWFVAGKAAPASGPYAEHEQIETPQTMNSAAISAAAQAWMDEHAPPTGRRPSDAAQALHDELARYGTHISYVQAAAPKGKEGRRASVLLTRRGVHGPGGDRRVGGEDRRGSKA